MDRLIVELLHTHGHGVEKRYVFEEGRATIGRSYSNDIILDDPFVSPKHLLVSRNGTGLYVKDLASENGTQINGERILQDQGAKIASGDEVCLGKTKLKLVLHDHPVEPARRLGSLVALRQFLDRSSVAIGFSLLMAALTAWMVYVAAPGEKFWNSESLAAVLGYLMIAGCYAGVVGLICYVKLHRAYFKRHLAVFNIGTFIWFIYSMGEPFLLFWISSPGLLAAAKYVPATIYMIVIFWASLRLVRDTVKWSDFAKLSSAALLFVLLSAWGSQDIRFEFSSSPSYPNNLAPYLEPLSEPGSFEDFLEKSGPKLYKNTAKSAAQ
jgi:hypothetical protein